MRQRKNDPASNVPAAQVKEANQAPSQTACHPFSPMPAIVKPEVSPNKAWGDPL